MILMQLSLSRVGRKIFHHKKCAKTIISRHVHTILHGGELSEKLE